MNRRTGLNLVNGSKLHEEPYTDPYVRFCGQTEALSASSDPINRVSVYYLSGSSTIFADALNPLSRSENA